MLLFDVSKGTVWRGRVKGGSYQWAGGCWLCALSGWRRVPQCNGQEPRKPSSKVNRTARLSSPGLCLFCPLHTPPEKCWHTASWLCAHTLQMGLQAPYLCAGSAAALELLPCALLGWFSSQKIPRMLLGYHCLQSACSFSMHAAAGSYGAETWKIASRDLAFLF